MITKLAGKFNITEVVRFKKGGKRKEEDSVLVVRIPKEAQVQHEPHFLVSIQLLDK